MGHIVMSGGAAAPLLSLSPHLCHSWNWHNASEFVSLYTAVCEEQCNEIMVYSYLYHNRVGYIYLDMCNLKKH